MAHVEIYKLRKTAPREVRGCSAFDFMHRGTAPDPAHYTKEWEGQMHGTLPLTIPGRLMLETPKDYHGGDIKNGDIAVVNGTPFYFDKLEGSKFIELDTFDGDKAREAFHADYGWFVDIKGARAISNDIANVCHDIGVPCGYLGGHSANEPFSRERPFLPGVSGEEHLNFLHPQFLKGDEAREFIESLTETMEAEPDKWMRIQSYLRELSPITLQDLYDAKMQFAPELLLPEVLRPLYKHIPTDADKTELAYLAAKIEGLDAEQRGIFNAVTEIGWQCGSVAEIINLSETLDCFELHPALNEEMYGAFRIECDWGECAGVIERLENSENPAERAVAKYVARLNRAADETEYGRDAVKEDGGIFTSHGMLTTSGSGEPRTVYRGMEDLPAEYFALSPNAKVGIPNRVTALHSTDLAATLLEMHAVGGGYMRDAQYNINSLAVKSDNFFIRMHPQMLIVHPAETVYHRDTDEHQGWMLLDESPDIRIFFMTVTERDNGQIGGGIYEVDLTSVQDSVRENSFFFTHIDAEMKNGTSRLFTLEEWDAMELYERDRLKSWVKHYDPADTNKLAAHIRGFQEGCNRSGKFLTSGEFFSRLNAPYMSLANNPNPDMLRIAPEAAREILAQGSAEVFRMTQGGLEGLSVIDAAKTAFCSFDREFAVRRYDRAGIEKWAHRGVGEILRRLEHRECGKSKNKGEEEL